MGESDERGPRQVSSQHGQDIEDVDRAKGGMKSNVVC